jgi:hypothetical protein
MAINVKGIISFPTLFVPEKAKGATEEKFSGVVLLPPTDPQVAAINAAVNEAKQNTFPQGFPAAGDVCFAPYDTKFGGKDYYDSRFSGWHVLSFTAKANDRPKVVDENFQDVLDPSKVFAGCVVEVNVGIGGYVMGKGGVGGFLNGVMLLADEPPMGRLDGKPSVEQMFGNRGNAAPGPNGPGAPAASGNAAPQFQMTASAQFSREEYHASGWTDEQLIAQGMMTKVETASAAPGPAGPGAPAAPGPAGSGAPAAPAAPQFQMTATAQYTREEYHASGWTDEQLIAQGLMTEGAPAAPQNYAFNQ